MPCLHIRFSHAVRINLIESNKPKPSDTKLKRAHFIKNTFYYQNKVRQKYAFKLYEITLNAYDWYNSYIDSKGLRPSNFID